MPTSIATMENGEHGVRVELADGRRVSCSLLVGADGGASRTRELAGIGRAGWAYGQTAVVAHLASEQPHRSTAWQRFLPSGPLALLPLKDGRVSLVWTLPAADSEQHLALDAGEFSRRVTEASDGALGELRLASPVAGFPLGLWHAREYCQPRLALVGDAAHVTHPLAGQGVNMGFLDCATLVEVLSKAVADEEDYSSMRVLRRYERWRKAENALFLGLADTLNRLFGDRGMASAAVRRMGLSVVGGQAFLRRTLAEHALGLRGDVPAIVSRPT
jgi:2-octaprenylphenol hydroxylase